MQVKPDRLTAITIIIPVKPGETPAALDAIRMQDYPGELVEIIISQGKQPSRQRNRAASRACGDIIYFLDDDSRPVNDALKRIAQWMADPSVGVVGGPSLTPGSDSPFQRAVAASLETRMGGGGVRNRYRSWGNARECGDDELILCNLAVRRPLFVESGGLDERLYPNEENELLMRIQRSGRKLLHDPELIVMRSQRKTLGAFMRQFFTYGRGRGEQTRIIRAIPLHSLVPPLFVLYLSLLPFTGSVQAAIPLLAYLLLLLATSVGVSLRKGWGIGFLTLFLIPLMHLLYGTGILAGVIRPRYLHRSENGEPELVMIKRLGDGWNFSSPLA